MCGPAEKNRPEVVCRKFILFSSLLQMAWPSWAERAYLRWCETTLLRPCFFRMVTTLFQHCNAVYALKSLLQISIPCNITFREKCESACFDFHVDVEKRRYLKIYSLQFKKNLEKFLSISLFIIENLKIKFFFDTFKFHITDILLAISKTVCDKLQFV